MASFSVCVGAYVYKYTYFFKSIKIFTRKPLWKMSQVENVTKHKGFAFKSLECKKIRRYRLFLSKFFHLWHARLHTIQARNSRQKYTHCCSILLKCYKSFIHTVYRNSNKTGVINPPSQPKFINLRPKLVLC